MKKFYLLFVALTTAFATNSVAQGLISGKSYSVLDGVAGKYWAPSDANENSYYKTSSNPYYFTVTVDGEQVSLLDQNGYYVGGSTSGRNSRYTAALSTEFKWTLATSGEAYTLYQDAISDYPGYAGGQSGKDKIYCNNESAVELTLTPALKVTYKFVDAEGTSICDDQTGYALTGEAYPAYTLPEGYKYVSGAPAEGATVADATAADETYTIVCSGSPAKTVTARIWKSKGSYSNWSMLPYKVYTSGEYYTCKVMISDGKVTFKDWEGTGDETNTLAITFNPSAASNNGLTVNGEEPDADYSTVWVDCKTISDDGYNGCYIYPTYSTITSGEESGSADICCYSYGISDYVDYLADWKMDDSYATPEKEITDVNWTVSITGAPEGSDPTITVGENTYRDGETFVYDNKLSASDITASKIDGYVSSVSVSFTSTTGTVAVIYSVDMTPVLPEDAVLSIGDKAATMTPATGAADNDHWYVVTQVRGGESMMYNNGSSTMMRGKTSETAASINGKAVSANKKYLVRFLPTDYTGVYNMQFADGSFIQTTLTTGAQSTAGMYFFYNINGVDGNFGWNLTTDGTTYGSIVDNNAAGNTLAFWSTGEVTYTGGNNDWYIYPATFVEAKPAVELTANATSVVVGTEITLTATASAFESEPTITYSYAKDGGETVILDGNTFTPSEGGKYVFTATARLRSTVATSNAVSVNVITGEYAGSWYLKNNDTDLYATYGIGYWGTEANLGSEGTQITIAVADGAYSIQFEGQSKYLGQNSWDSQCYADGPQAAYTIEPSDNGLIIMTGTQYLTYAWDTEYSVNNIVWGTTPTTWTLLNEMPTAIKSISEKNTNLADGKYWINGSLVIVKDGMKYNATGRRM